MALRVQPLGDLGIRIEFGLEISRDINQQIRRFCLSLAEARIPGVFEWVPAYTTVAVYYQPWLIRYEALCQRVQQIAGEKTDTDLPDEPLIVIPTVYGGMYGPDLEVVARLHDLRPEEVIGLHTAPEYWICLIGFLPGFPYLGGLSPEIATPRHSTPRLHVPRGSVGIAGAQTGIYPLETPGGWQIIGRTPLVLYDPQRDPPSLLRVGQRVRFVPMTPDEYESCAIHRPKL